MKPKKEKKCKCSCAWGDECMSLHKRFAKTDDPRGKDPIRLNLSGSSETMATWKKVVIKNLKINENNVKRWRHVNIMRHHWSPDQLKHFLMVKPKNTHPLRCHVLTLTEWLMLLKGIILLSEKTHNYCSML